MKHWDWSIPHKPYDLRERLFQFACLIVQVVEYLHTRGRVASSLSDQILKAGISAGANYEESDDGSSPADTLAKRKIALRELKEVHFRMRVLRAKNYLTTEQDTVIQEADELRRILAKLVRNSSS